MSSPPLIFCCRKVGVMDNLPNTKTHAGLLRIPGRCNFILRCTMRSRSWYHNKNENKKPWRNKTRAAFIQMLTCKTLVTLFINRSITVLRFRYRTWSRLPRTGYLPGATFHGNVDVADTPRSAQWRLDQHLNTYFKLQRSVKFVYCRFEVWSRFGVFQGTDTYPISNLTSPASRQHATHGCFCMDSLAIHTTSNLYPWLDRNETNCISRKTWLPATSVCRRRISARTTIWKLTVDYGRTPQWTHLKC